MLIICSSGNERCAFVIVQDHKIVPSDVLKIIKNGAKTIVEMCIHTEAIYRTTRKCALWKIRIYELWYIMDIYHMCIQISAINNTIISRHHSCVQ